MRAAIFEEFGQLPRIREVPDPVVDAHSVVVDVQANGICRSDWHAWQGHDPGVSLPHVPGHELAGTVSAVGDQVRNISVGDRVTVPFASGCGDCRYCRAGQLHICDHDSQPGFTHWGAFAEKVKLDYADLNVVQLPDQLDFSTAASLGCRFATAYWAVVRQGRIAAGDWLAVHGCGGLGLSIVQIAKAMDAHVVAIDVFSEKLDFAQSLGADAIVDASIVDDVVARVHEITMGGADCSLDAVGNTVTCINSIFSLRKQGRHVQAGLMLGVHARPQLPLDRVIGWELELLGTHGMPANQYPQMLELVVSGQLRPERLIRRRIALSEAPAALAGMAEFDAIGITMIEDFTA